MKAFDFLFKKYWALGGCLCLVLVVVLGGLLFRLGWRVDDARMAERLAVAVADPRLRAWADERFREYRERHPNPGDDPDEFIEPGPTAAANGSQGTTETLASGSGRNMINGFAFFEERRNDFGRLLSIQVSRQRIMLWFSSPAYHSLYVFSRDCPEETIEKECKGIGERSYRLGEKVYWSGRHFRG